MAEARGVARILATRGDTLVSCGRQALALLWPLLRGDAPVPATLTRPGADDASLFDVHRIANALEMDLAMVRRPAGARPVAPAILHLNLGHWTVLVRTDGDRYLLRDPGLGGEVWVTREALATEWSGLALVPADSAASSWGPVEARVAHTVIGRSVCPPGAPSPDEPPCPEGCCAGGAGPGDSGGGGGSCGST